MTTSVRAVVGATVATTFVTTKFLLYFMLSSMKVKWNKMLSILHVGFLFSVNVTVVATTAAALAVVGVLVEAEGVNVNSNYWQSICSDYIELSLRKFIDLLETDVIENKKKIIKQH